MNTRRLAVGSNAMLTAVLLALVFAAMAELCDRTAWRFDLSADGLASLDPDAEAVVALLEAQGAEVTITAFSAQARDAEAVLRDRTMRDHLIALEQASARVTTRFVDFDRDRLTAERMGVERYGTVVVEGRGDRVDLIEREVFRARGPRGKRDLDFLGEAAIAAAIRQVLSERNPVLYALTGHGERPIFDRGIGELKALSERLDGQGWTVRSLDLLRAGSSESAPSVPGDASAVLMIGPRAPLTPTETEALQAYLGGGGSLGVFVDPGGAVPDLLTALGVSVPTGVALDPVYAFPHVDRPVLRYGNHPITEALIGDDVATVLALAAAIDVTARDGVVVSPLLSTSRRGWIERGTESPSTFDPAVDGAGPVVVAVVSVAASPVAFVRPGKTARALVVGDADLVGDELLVEGPGNSTFVINALRWLVRTDERLGRVGAPVAIRRLELGGSQVSVVRWTLVGGMPALAVLGGLFMLFLRRDR